MRADSLGLWWRDEPVIKVKSIKQTKKKTPPKPVWLEVDYLPGYEQALNWKPDLFTNEELIEAQLVGETLVFDLEVYGNYFLAAFKSVQSKKIVYFEMDYSKLIQLDKLEWILRNFQIVSFNGIEFDQPILSIVLAGQDTHTLKEATNAIIVEKIPHWMLSKRFEFKDLNGINHIDLIEVAPLDASLKIYGGRMHTKRMQDLPIQPNALLTEPQKLITLWYCVNDLDQTIEMWELLKPQIDLRIQMGQQYGQDLRSKSDAQIAEAVIAKELTNITGSRPKKPEVLYGHSYKYVAPHFIKYNTPIMQGVLKTITDSDFILNEFGKIVTPKAIDALKINIGFSTYQVGIGGLHSTENNLSHYADEKTILVDRDVTSYYPMIILILGLFPKHLGTAFLRIFRKIVEQRIAAKHNKQSVIADSLKIVVNGTFGKLSNQYSILFSPDLLIAVTITGQLSLLMLIERLELAGISVVSGNTDGIVIKCPKDKEGLLNHIITQWEKDTGFETEETCYKSIHSRDVNNYIAIGVDGKVKNKGAYSNPWGSDKNKAFRLAKNPVCTVAIEAVEQFLKEGIPLDVSIKNCKDITKFLTVRKVNGGAVKQYSENDIVYLGKAVRWYYAADASGELVYAKTGNKVPKSEGAEPLMELPDAFPSNVDYDRYVSEAERILSDIGVMV